MSRTARKFSRNFNFSYTPCCHHCVKKLTAILSKFHIDYRVISGNIDSVCACEIKGRAKDKLIIKFVRRVFKQHKERTIGFIKDFECLFETTTGGEKNE